MLRTLVRSSKSRGPLSSLTALFGNSFVKESASELQSKIILPSPILTTTATTTPDIKKKQEKEDGVMHLLEKPSKNIDLEIKERVRSLEKFELIEKRHIKQVFDNLNYVLNTFGAMSNSLTPSQQELMNSLIKIENSNYKEVIEKAHDVNDLMLIFSYLILKHEMSLYCFIKIVMKLNLEKLITVDQKLKEEHFILNFETDKQISIKAQIVIASRYKMLGASMLSDLLISKNMNSVWLPAIKFEDLTSAVYYKNIVNLVKGSMNEPDLIESVIESDIPKLAYCFWESNPMSSRIKQYLEEVNYNRSEMLSEYQSLIVSLASAPLISSNRKYSVRLSKLSQRFHLYNSSQNIPQKRLIAYLDALISDLRNDITCDSLNYNDLSKSDVSSMLTEIDEKLNPYKGSAITYHTINGEGNLNTLH